MKILERIIIALLIVALLLAILGLILTNKAVTFAAMGLLIAVSGAFAVMQTICYLKDMESDNKKQLLIMMIVAIVVFLAVVSLSILTFSGKLFGGIIK